MGEAKNKSYSHAAMLKAEARCIYCDQKPTTVEHMPPLSMFRDRSRPRGLEFAACLNCNRNTSAADLVATFISRIAPFDERDPWKFEDLKNQRFMLEKKAPGLVAEILRTEKRHEIWVKNGSGILQRTTEVKGDGPLLTAYLSVFSAKLAMALYREHVGSALPMTGNISASFYLNRGLTQKTADILLKRAPSYATLKQGKAGVPDQFAYRFNTDGKSIVYALAQFQSNLSIVLMATSRPEFFDIKNNPLFRLRVKPGEIVSLMPGDIAQTLAFAPRMKS